MKILVTSLAFVFIAGAAMVSSAQTTPAPALHAHPSRSAAAPAQTDVPAATHQVVTVVKRFGQALAAGDLKTVETLLATDVLILEAGGAERSRDQYLAHHAISDAKFLKGAHRELKHRRARIAGDLAWVGTESELHASRDGKPLTLLNTETMVLKKIGADWRIVHIHWSSRPKKTK